jgi:dienelactone hydrolase
MESALPYASGETRYSGVLLQNVDREPRCAVVLLPDWQGQSALAREHAQALADTNCAVAIADLYGGGFSPTDPSQVGDMVKRLSENRALGVRALQACIDAVRERLPSGVPVFCLGYSAGGMIALDYGRSGAHVAGIILCSALLKTAEPGSDTRIPAPVLVLQGTQDVVSPMGVVGEVVAEMDAAGNDFRFALYGQTHHGFDNPNAGTDPNARLVYSPGSAKSAHRAIVDFIVERTSMAATP